MCKCRNVNDYKLREIIERSDLVYCGRSHRYGGPSKFANPFRLSPQESRGTTLARYRRYLWLEIRSANITIEELRELDGKTLLCHCKPGPCHLDVLKRAVAWALNQ